MKRKRRGKVDDPAVALTAPLGKYHVRENRVSLAFGAADIFVQMINLIIKNIVQTQRDTTKFQLQVSANNGKVPIPTFPKLPILLFRYR